MGITQIEVFGYSNLIVQQIKSIYQTKNPRMRDYRNAEWDLIDHFFHAFNISVVLGEENNKFNASSEAASNF